MMHRINLDRKVSDGPPKEVQSSHVCIESATMPKINSDSQNKASRFRRRSASPLCFSSIHVQPVVFCTDDT